MPGIAPLPATCPGPTGRRRGGAFVAECARRAEHREARTRMDVRFLGGVGCEPRLLDSDDLGLFDEVATVRVSERRTLETR